MQIIEHYLQGIGFKENEWGFLCNKIDDIEFVLMKDPLSGYTLSYTQLTGRTAGHKEIPLGRTLSLNEFKTIFKEIKPTFMKLALINTTEEDLVSGTFHIKTTDQKFVDEVRKYKCPFRLANFLTEENKKSFTDLEKELPDSYYDYIIDFKEQTEKTIDEMVKEGKLFSLVPDTYIQATPHLDKYGNKILDEELYVIEYLYGKDIAKAKETSIYKGKTYYGWYIDGYETIQDLRKQFPTDDDIEKLYNMDLENHL